MVEVRFWLAIKHRICLILLTFIQVGTSEGLYFFPLPLSEVVSTANLSSEHGSAKGTFP